MCLVRCTYLKHPEEWRLPWAELLRDVGNVGCVSKAARNGCTQTIATVVRCLRQTMSSQEADLYDTLRPVVAGMPFPLTVRKLLPFTAASCKDLAAKAYDYYLLKTPTKMPVELLEMRRIEARQRVRASDFIRHLHRLGDVTARGLLYDAKYSPYLNGSAYSVIPLLCRSYGSPEHARQKVKRLQEQKRQFYHPSSCKSCGNCHYSSTSCRKHDNDRNVHSRNNKA